MPRMLMRFVRLYNGTQLMLMLGNIQLITVQIDFLRPTAGKGSTWYVLLKKAGGGCNDLICSGHMLVAVLTAVAWTEAYGGFSSAFI